MDNQPMQPNVPNNTPSGGNHPLYSMQPIAPLPCYPPPAQPPVTFAPKQDTPIEKESNQPRGLLMVALVFFSSLFFSEMLLRGGFFGLAVPVCITLFYALAFWYLKGRENAFSKNSMLMLIPIGILSFSYLFDPGLLTWFVTSVTLMFLIPAQLTVMSGASIRTMFSSRIFPETMKTAIGKTICNMHTPFRSFRVLRNFGTKSKTLMMALVGVLCAVPFLLIFSALFSKADAAFSYYMNNLSAILSFNLGTIVFDLFFGSMIAIVLASFLFVLRGAIPEQTEVHTVTGKLNVISTSVFLIFILLLQGLFIITQFAFLFGGNPLPDGMSYGEYAHSGFFQIATASIITALIVLCISLFGKRTEKGVLPCITKVLLTILTVFDFFLYYCAYVRMFNYISAYDLSVKRIGVCWLMALMGLILAGVALKMWLPKMNLTGWAIICTCLMVIALNAINPDRLTANYNIDEYLTSLRDNTSVVRSLDVRYLGSLSSGTAIELDRLKGTPMEEKAKKSLERMWYRTESKSWKNMTVVDSEIRDVMKRWDIIQPSSAD